MPHYLYLLHGFALAGLLVPALGDARAMQSPMLRTEASTVTDDEDLRVSGYGRGAIMARAGPALAGELGRSAVAAIEAVAYDYVDGQLEGNAARVARALHPDLAKRAVVGDRPTGRELFPLRRMSADELIRLTADGALKTPRAEWRRSVDVLDITGNAAVARVETPWFVDYFHLGRFGDRWLIVNALWWSKPQPQNATKTK